MFTFCKLARICSRAADVNAGEDNSVDNTILGTAAVSRNIVGNTLGRNLLHLMRNQIRRLHTFCTFFRARFEKKRSKMVIEAEARWVFVMDIATCAVGTTRGRRCRYQIVRAFGILRWGWRRFWRWCLDRRQHRRMLNQRTSRLIVSYNQTIEKIVF